MINQTLWLSCSVLSQELQFLKQEGKITGELIFLDSMLHMVPRQLECKLKAELDKQTQERQPLVLVFGDCCARMLDFVRWFRVGRVNSINCAQLLLGRARYRQLMKSQAFLFLPEWTHRWQEILETRLGLSREIAREMMCENRNELVYLDTGLVPIPTPHLEACSAYTGLPWRIETVSLDPLLTELLAAEATAVSACINQENL